jgi:small subunit ribosomal protein S4
MSRYTGPVCRRCRREGQKLYLKGEKCYSDKCPVAKRPYAPGEHGQMRKKASEYALQLREKQKAKRIYGVGEAQFRRYFQHASRSRGVTGEALLQTLEQRLDNVIYRAGFSNSRAFARQLVRHGHFAVNGSKVSIPSYLLREGDVVSLRPRAKKSDLGKYLAELAKNQSYPDWLEVNPENMEFRVNRIPHREEIDVPVEEHSIVELYSR